MAATDQPVEKQTKEVSVWGDSDVELLKSWAENSMCYNWLHEQSFHKYNKIYNQLNIPIIILSGINSGISFMQSQYTDISMRNIFATVIGAISLFVGIIASLLSFYKISDKKEDHRNYAKQWDKLEQDIRMQLSKPPSERLPKNIMMEETQKKLEQLLDKQPAIGNDIKKLWALNFPELKISKPRILGDFTHITIGIEKKTGVNESDIDMSFKDINGRVPTSFEKDVIQEMKQDV